MIECIEIFNFMSMTLQIFTNVCDGSPLVPELSLNKSTYFYLFIHYINYYNDSVVFRRINLFYFIETIDFMNNNNKGKIFVYIIIKE